MNILHGVLVLPDIYFIRKASSGLRVQTIYGRQLPRTPGNTLAGFLLDAFEGRTLYYPGCLAFYQKGNYMPYQHEVKVFDLVVQIMQSGILSYGGSMLQHYVVQGSCKGCLFFASSIGLLFRRPISTHRLASLREICFRALSTRARNDSSPIQFMNAWYTNEYGSNDVLEFGSQPLPRLRKATDVLVRVHSASVNPIDFRMRSGYGETLLNVWRKMENTDEFPLILGRDFSGEVVKTGRMARRFTEGEQVCNLLSDPSSPCHWS